jgi:hypothetical protein
MGSAAAVGVGVLGVGVGKPDRTISIGFGDNAAIENSSIIGLGEWRGAENGGGVCASLRKATFMGSAVGVPHLCELGKTGTTFSGVNCESPKPSKLGEWGGVNPPMPGELRAASIIADHHSREAQ